MSTRHHKYQYVVICRGCGIQPLSRENYLTQLRAANTRWACPQCGGPASWDDNSLETDPPDCGVDPQTAYEEHKALEEVVNAWNNGGGFALVQACEKAKKTLTYE